MSVCAACGYGYGVKRLGLLVDGGLELELDLCLEHRLTLTQLARDLNVGLIATPYIVRDDERASS